MKAKKALIGAVMGFAGLATLPSQATVLSDLQNAINNGTTDLNFRYRYELVDQDGIDKNAHASTLRTRLGFTSADFNGFYLKLEADNVSVVGNDLYNSTANQKTQYPVVADPAGTEMNQAFLAYKTGQSELSAGRQRINHNDQRFVGGVGWRQNEQTYDGYRYQYKAEALSLDYAYVYNVNRIFGPDGPRADLGGSLHLFNSNYQIDKNHQLAFYLYDMDFDTAAALSNRTIGLSYNGKFDNFSLHAAYAIQKDGGANPVDYLAEYWNLQASTQLASVNLTLGYEYLGSDNGKGFVTPLATLHKFQGFADNFLSTPANGVEDLYVQVAGKQGKLSLSAILHQLGSQTGGIDYGNELDLVASYPLADKLNLLIKYAYYDADEYSVDTQKLWGMLSLSF